MGSSAPWGTGFGGNGCCVWVEDVKETDDGGAAVSLEGAGGDLTEGVGGARVEGSVAYGSIKQGEYGAGEDNSSALGQVRRCGGNMEAGGGPEAWETRVVPGFRLGDFLSQKRVKSEFQRT